VAEVVALDGSHVRHAAQATKELAHLKRHPGALAVSVGQEVSVGVRATGVDRHPDLDRVDALSNEDRAGPSLEVVHLGGQHEVRGVVIAEPNVPNAEGEKLTDARTGFPQAPKEAEGAHGERAVAQLRRREEERLEFGPP
jgi:hypothetical protein